MTLYAPPKLSNPRTYTIYRNGVSIIVECDDVNIPDAIFNEEDIVFLNVSNTIDCIFKFPEELTFSGLRVDNCNNVRIIGGKLNALRPADAQLRAMLRIGGQASSVFIEGVHIDCKNQNGMDALVFGGWSNQVKTPDIYIQECLFEGTRNEDGSPYHSDGMQFYGSVNNLRICNVDIKTGTQGLFLAPQWHRVGSIDMRNVTIQPTPDANGYPLYLRDANENDRPSVQMWNVFVGEREYNPQNKPLDKLWELYSVFPHAEMENGCKNDDGFISWQHNFPEITGGVRKLTNESFAPENVGVGYEPAYYEGVETRY